MLATISVLSTYNLQCIVSTLYSIENKDNQALEFETLLSEILLSISVFKSVFVLSALLFKSLA